MVTVSKTIPLCDGGEIPAIRLGTWTVWGELGKPEENEAAAKAAIDAGFRHIDCAWIYKNEDNIGNALKAKIDDGTVKREEMFITTKLWDMHHNPSLIRKALEDSLKRLKTPFVDMYLIHWPTALKDGDFTYDEIVPKNKDGKILFARYKHEDMWKVMEECQKAGLAKHIGLSNFNSKQITHVLENCTIKPSNLQIEISPYFSNKKLVDFCKGKGMVVTAYAPFGAPARPWRNEGEPSPFEEPLLKEMAAAKGKSIAQVFDFELSGDGMTKIASLNQDLRVYKEPITFDHPDYPFDESF